MKVKEKLQEILKNNPDAKAELVGYYKYCFEFYCEGVSFEIGGDSGDIYRLSLNKMNLLKHLIDLVE